MAGGRTLYWSLVVLQLALYLVSTMSRAVNTQIGKENVRGLQPRQQLLEVQDDARVDKQIKEINFKIEEELKEDHRSTINAYLDRYAKEMENPAAGLAYQTSQLMQSQENESNSGLLEWLLTLYKKGRCGSQEDRRSYGVNILEVARDNLVVVPAGDGFDASKWMNDPKQSNWDVITIYYGKNASFSCPLCEAVYRASGPKWRLAWGLTLLPEWEHYRKQYSAIMFADDDLVLDVCTINTVFTVMKAYKLLMAQPSVCNSNGSFTLWKALYQQTNNVLRYTTMIEIMAPTFEMDYFQNFIRPSLHNAHVGWGLDFVWPFLLNYPRDKIAVIDQVCMFHPSSGTNKAGSVYNADAPYRKEEEETRRFAEYGYFDSEILKKGFSRMAVQVVGVIPKPTDSQAMPKESAMASMIIMFHSRLGPLYPLLVILQSFIIMLGFLIIRRKIRTRWRQVQ